MYNKHGGYRGSRDVVDYSININPLGVSARLKSEIVDSIDDLENYPEIDGASVIQKLSTIKGISQEHLIVGNGATELIYLFSRGLKIKKAIVIEPTFTEYAKSVEIVGGRVERVQYDLGSSSLDWEALQSKLDGTVDAVFLCNPNNPTGTVVSKSEIKRLLDISKESGALTFIDESFLEFSDMKSSAQYVDDYDLFILRSVTKIYAVPGIRIGYGLGSRDVIASMKRVKEPWSVNSLALKTLDVYLEDEEYISKTKAWFQKSKDEFMKSLGAIPSVKVFQSQANFVLLRLGDGNAHDLQDYLEKRGYYIRICEDFFGLDDSYIRLAIRKVEENRDLASAIADFYGGDIGE